MGVSLQVLVANGCSDKSSEHPPGSLTMAYWLGL